VFNIIIDCVIRAWHAQIDDDQMIEELQYTYSMLLKSPALVPLLGEFDHEFAHLVTPGAVERWVEKRLIGVLH
jgi:hypothetical protein